MDKDSLYLELQPIFNIWSGEISYAEVLLRSKCSGIDVIDIIGGVEGQEDSLELDKVVLDMAMETIEGSGLKKVAINLCKDTLDAEDAYKDIVDTIDKWQVEFSRVVLEVNEYTNYNSLYVIDNVHELHERGIEIAIDDFGVGNNTLGNLINIPASIVKFDKKYVDRGNISALRGLVITLHNLGIDTILEGVETEEQLERAKEIGYRNVQGFLLGKPVDIETFKELYKQ